MGLSVGRPMREGILDDEERLVLDRFYIHRTKDSVGELCDQSRGFQATTECPPKCGEHPVLTLLWIILL